MSIILNNTNNTTLLYLPPLNHFSQLYSASSLSLPFLSLSCFSPCTSRPLLIDLCIFALLAKAECNDLRQQMGHLQLLLSGGEAKAAELMKENATIKVLLPSFRFNAQQLIIETCY